jgi:hypothetical protein
LLVLAAAGGGADRSFAPSGRRVSGLPALAAELVQANVDVIVTQAARRSLCPRRKHHTPASLRRSARSAKSYGASAFLWPVSILSTGPFIYSFERVFRDRFLGAAQPCACICGVVVLAQGKTPGDQVTIVCLTDHISELDSYKLNFFHPKTNLSPRQE